MSETVKTLTAIQRLLDGEWTVAVNPETQESLTTYSMYCLLMKKEIHDLNPKSITYIKSLNQVSCLIPVNPEFLDKTWEDSTTLVSPFTIEPLDGIAKLLGFPHSRFEYEYGKEIRKMDWGEMCRNGIPYAALTTKWRQVR